MYIFYKMPMSSLWSLCCCCFDRVSHVIMKYSACVTSCWKKTDGGLWYLFSLPLYVRHTRYFEVSVCVTFYTEVNRRRPVVYSIYHSPRLMMYDTAVDG